MNSASLETFAVNQVIQTLCLSGNVEIVEKNRRKRLFETIMDSIDEDVLATWKVNLDSEEGESLVDAFRNCVPSMPDGMIIDVDNQTVYFIEIEFGNFMSIDKLRKYLDARWWLDCVNWTLILISANRYGANAHPIDLVALYGCSVRGYQ